MRVLIDSHCHLDDPSFDSDRLQVIDFAQQYGVKIQIIPAVDVISWERIKKICNQFKNLYGAYGLHPCYAHQPADISALESWLSREKSVAVGECGLDYFIPDADRAQQQWFFERQLSIAQTVDLPVILHARRSVDDVIKNINKFKNLRGVVHSFVGSEQQAKRLIDRGFLLGFGGTITYPRANRLRRLIQTLPLESILLETDAPDQPLFGKQGQRNEPAFLIHILNTVAQLRQTDPETLSQRFSQNTIQLFKL
jgi:TatD DNase family protein